MPEYFTIRQKITALIAVLILAAAINTWLRHRPVNMEKKAAAMHRAGGATMAELAAMTLGGKGSVLLIVPDETQFDSRQAQWIRAQEQAFASRAGAITIEGREVLAAIVSRVNMASNRPAAFTPAVYRDMVKRHPSASAAVSFVGAPVPPPGEAMPKKENLPPMICFSLTGERVADAMAAGLVAAAIVPRATAAPAEKGIRGDWFDLLYETVTPDTVVAWAEKMRPPARRR